MDGKESIREYFDRSTNWQGEVYDTGADPHAAGVRRRIDYVFGMLCGIPGFGPGIALDVGCGPGAYLAELSRLGWRCFGIDISTEMLKACERRLGMKPGVNLLTGDAENIPFGPDAVDLLLSIGVIQYLHSPAKALSEMARVLRPDGLAVVCFQNLFSLSNLDWAARRQLALLFKGGDNPRRRPGDRLLSMASPYFEHHPIVPHRYVLFNPWAFESLMELAGFTLEASMTYGYEFRLLRKVNLVPGRALSRIETALERIFRKTTITYFRYSGEFYIGVYRKRPAAAVPGRTPVRMGAAICAAV
jgi:SAM-dependent methyltransferase